ncbi:MAG: CopG family transcriptional regulator [Ruminococcaceae bacterium]|nr:CopG family transcriptional regulator [Oscillospiraceae bacterium]
MINLSNGIIKINKKGEDGYKIISVRIKEGTLKKIDDLSQKSNRSRNELINIILENSVDDVEIN